MAKKLRESVDLVGFTPQLIEAISPMQLGNPGP